MSLASLPSGVSSLVVLGLSMRQVRCLAATCRSMRVACRRALPWDQLTAMREFATTPELLAAHSPMMVARAACAWTTACWLGAYAMWRSIAIDVDGVRRVIVRAHEFTAFFRVTIFMRHGLEEGPPFELRPDPPYLHRTQTMCHWSARGWVYGECRSMHITRHPKPSVTAIPGRHDRKCDRVSAQLQQEVWTVVREKSLSDSRCTCDAGEDEPVVFMRVVTDAVYDDGEPKNAYLTFLSEDPRSLRRALRGVFSDARPGATAAFGDGTCEQARRGAATALDGVVRRRTAPRYGESTIDYAVRINWLHAKYSGVSTGAFASAIDAVLEKHVAR